jgi:hypothetical protein
VDLVIVHYSNEESFFDVGSQSMGQQLTNKAVAAAHEFIISRHARKHPKLEFHFSKAGR